MSPERAAALVVAVRLGVAAFNAAKSGGGPKGLDTGKAPYTSTVSPDAEAGMPYAHPVKEAGPKGISITIEPKIADQMGKRGWTESSIQSVIDKPVKTVVTKDTRFDTVSGSRLNDPATGYIAKDGSYVVRNDRTGAIVQVSNKKDPEWVAPWD
jgi:filamentous hemagglutinin